MLAVGIIRRDSCVVNYSLWTADRGVVRRHVRRSLPFGSCPSHSSLSAFLPLAHLLGARFGRPCASRHARSHARRARARDTPNPSERPKSRPIYPLLGPRYRSRRGRARRARRPARASETHIHGAGGTPRRGSRAGENGARQAPPTTL